MLFIEYDVTPEGEIQPVALINAIEEHGEDPDGTAWLAWRGSEFDDEGFGCAAVSAQDLARLEKAQDPDDVRAIMEAILLADRAHKEAARP